MEIKNLEEHELIAGLMQGAKIDEVNFLTNYQEEAVKCISETFGLVVNKKLDWEDYWSITRSLCEGICVSHARKVNLKRDIIPNKRGSVEND